MAPTSDPDLHAAGDVTTNNNNSNSNSKQSSSKNISHIDVVRTYYSANKTRIYNLFFDNARHCGLYDASSPWNPLRFLVCPTPVSPALRRLERLVGARLALPPDARVLDLGCGSARVACTLAAPPFSFRVHGVDLMPHHLLEARDLVDTAAAVTLQELDFHRVGKDLAPESFDGACSVESLVHASNPRAVVAGLFRVLKPGGRLSHCEFEYEYEYDEYDDEHERLWSIVKKKLSLLRRLRATIWRNAGLNKNLPPGAWRAILTETGFVDVKVEDITARVAPSGVIAALICLVLAFANLLLLGVRVPPYYWHPNHSQNHHYQNRQQSLHQNHPSFTMTVAILLLPLLNPSRTVRYVHVSARKPGQLEEVDE